MRIVFLKNPSCVRRRSRSSIIVHYENRYREVNIRDIEVLVIIGSKTLIESGVYTLLSSHNIPVVVVNKLGVSIASGHFSTVLNEARARQYVLGDEARLGIAGEIILARFHGLNNISFSSLLF